MRYADCAPDEECCHYSHVSGAIYIPSSLQVYMEIWAVSNLRKRRHTPRKRNKGIINLPGLIPHRQKHNAGKDIRKHDSHPGHTACIRAAQDLGRFARARHEQDRARRGVQGPDSGGDHADHDQGVDEVCGGQDSGVREGDC